MPTTLEKALKCEYVSADLGKVFDYFVQACGGEYAYAMLLKQNFDAAEDGSLAKAKIFELVMRLGKINEHQEKNEDLGIMSEDDLSKLLSHLVNRINATEEKATPD